MKKGFLFPLLVITFFLSGCNLPKTANIAPSVAPALSSLPVEEGGGVLLPTQEDIVRTFINLISEKRIPEAVSMKE